MKLNKGKVLLVDNEDSFTFNLVQIFEDLRLNIVLVNGKSEFKEEYMDFDGFVFSPGPGIPDDFPLMKSILGENSAKPVLGICLGMQAIAEFYGASLYQMRSVEHGQVKTVYICSEGDLFKGIPDYFQVGLYHSWAVDPESVPQTLEITCESENHIPMGLKHKSSPIEGLQFHPESFLTPYGRQLIDNWSHNILRFKEPD